MSKVVVDLCDSSGEEPRGSAVVEPCVSAVIEPCVSAGASTSAVINLCSPAVADTSAGGKQRNRKERNGKEPIDVGARSDDGAPDSSGYVVIDLCGDDDAVGADQDSDKGFARQLQLAFDGIECIGERFEGCAEVGPSSKRRRGGANDTLQDQLERDISQSQAAPVTDILLESRNQIRKWLAQHTKVQKEEDRTPLPLPLPLLLPLLLYPRTPHPHPL